MGDFPEATWPPPPILTTYSPECMGLMANIAGTAGSMGNAASVAWPVANRAYAFPFVLTQPALVKQLLYWVGGTSAGNIDVGIYDSQLNRIVSSGSTAAGTANTVQAFNVTDTWLMPGEYYLAVVCTSTTGTMFALTAIADEILLAGNPVYMDDLGSGVLPNPLVPAVSTEDTILIPVIGIQFASVF